MTFNESERKRQAKNEFFLHVHAERVRTIMFVFKDSAKIRTMDIQTLTMCSGAYYRLFESPARISLRRFSDRWASDKMIFG